MLPAKPFYMIRHGETQANRDRIFAGQSDDWLLTDLGREQAHEAKNAVKALKTRPSVIVHSNLLRAHDTSTIINEALNLPMHEEADIAERDVGDWVGQSYDVLGDKKGRPNDEGKNARSSHISPPNGENYLDFFARIERGIGKILETYDSPVLIVSHGGVFRSFGGIYDLSVPAKTKNCHFYEFQPNPDKSPLPWDVFSYDYDKETDQVIRVKKSLYDNCKIAEENK